eukprot:5906478-Amphidinium_carterae.2
MLLEEHAPAGQRWDNVKSVLLGAYTRQGCGVSNHTKPKAALVPLYFHTCISWRRLVHLLNWARRRVQRNTLAFS